MKKVLKCGRYIKKVLKYGALILGTMIFLFGVAFGILLMGITDGSSIYIWIHLTFIPLSIYCFVKKKKGKGAYLLVLWVLLLIDINMCVGGSRELYGAGARDMTFVERADIIIEYDELTEEEQARWKFNKRREYEISTLSYDNEERFGNVVYHYNNDEDSIKSINIIKEAINSKGKEVEKLFNIRLEYDLHVAINYDEKTEYLAYVNENNIMYVMPYREEGFGEEYFKNVAIHEYAHVLTLEILVEKGTIRGYGFSPLWFIEGLGEWVEVNIGTSVIDKEALFKVDLSKGEYGTTTMQIENFYNASAMVVGEIIKDVGFEGVEKCLEIWAKDHSKDAVKEVTGKSLEDYYYIFE